MGADWNEIVMARLSWTPTIALKKEPVAWVLGGLATFAVFLFVTFAAILPSLCDVRF